MMVLLAARYFWISKSGDIYQGYNAKHEQLLRLSAEKEGCYSLSMSFKTDILKSTLICHACFDHFDGVLLDYLLL